MSQPLQTAGLEFSTGEKIYIGDNGLTFVYKNGEVLEEITLEDLREKLTALSISDGQLQLKDTSTGKLVSLSSILGSTTNWQNTIRNGSLWWNGSQTTNHLEFANIPASETCSDTTPVLWSIDKDLARQDLVSSNKTGCDADADWQWFDVSGLYMVIPAITDEFKIAHITSSIAYTSRNDISPVSFRLYDATSGTELSRVSVQNSNENYNTHTINLSYTDYVEKNIGCSPTDSIGSCGVCNDIECLDGDPYTFEPNNNYTAIKYTGGQRLIKIQYHTEEVRKNHFDRIFGNYNDGNFGALSKINVVIYNSNSKPKDQGLYGSQTFSKENTKDIVFPQELDNNTYHIALSCNKNMNSWFSNKTSNGFTINVENKLDGIIDWMVKP